MFFYETSKESKKKYNNYKDEAQCKRDLEVDNISKYFGDFAAVDSVSFCARHGEFVSLLGPSGCGKTTTLRVIAGFVPPSKGTILIGGRDITCLSPHKRNVGLVFQNYALWPHMTVFDNIAFGLKLRKLKKEEIEKRVSETISLMSLSGLENRFPRELSGGQQQRVALGRIAALDLNLYLMDEPLSNLDKKLRAYMRVELANLQKKLGVTTVYVTHDQEEALSMSDKIILMNKGKIVQVGSPNELYEHPQHEFVADFIGTINSLEGEILDISDKNMLLFKTKYGFTLNVEAKTTNGLEFNKKEKVFIRPENVKISKDLGLMKVDKEDNVIPGIIVFVDYHGKSIDYHVEIKKDCRIIVQCYDTGVRCHRNERVFVKLEPSKCFFIKKTNEGENG